jgi:opacity protein-like surface antigen
MKKMMILLAAAAAAISTSASAAPITSLPGGSPVALPAKNQVTGGPVVFGPGIIFQSSNSSSVFGYTGGYGFGSNGGWSDVPMIGLNTNNGFFTLTFASAISSFLAEVNWTANNPTNATMGVYDVAGNLIESLTLEANGVNQVPVGFHGFSETSNSIKSIRFSNEYIGIRNISTATAAGAVPEPATWAMMILGMGAVGFAMRRRRKNVTTTVAYAA